MSSKILKEIEIIEHNKIRLAEIVRKDLKVDKTTFFSEMDSSFQFGFVAHKKGYTENIHYHKKIKRVINDLQQALFVQSGKLIVDFFDENKKQIAEVKLEQGDAINIVSGLHRIRIIEDCQCLTIKQGPFISPEMDKVDV